MKSHVKTSVALACSFWAGVATSAGEDHTNLEKIVADFDTLNPGLEIAVPRFVFTDTSGDTYPDFMAAWFDIYPLGSTAILHSTSPRSYLTPVKPAACTSVTEDDFSFFPKYNRTDDNSRAVISIAMTLFCIDPSFNVQSSENTAIYSATMDGTSSVWRYFGKGLSLTGSGILDTNTDGIEDTFVLMTTFSAAGGGENAWVVTLDIDSGQILSNSGYPMLR